MTDTVTYIIRFFAPLVAFFLMARFLLQASKADFYNPISQGIVALTDPLLKPLRAIIPPFKNFDLSAILCAWLLQAALDYSVIAIKGSVFYGVPHLLVVSLVAVLQVLLQIYWFMIIISIVSSWIAPGSSHPALELVSLTDKQKRENIRLIVGGIGVRAAVARNGDGSLAIFEV